MGNDSVGSSATPTQFSTGTPQEGNSRTIHDGFATIRFGPKRGRSRSSSSLAPVDLRSKKCPICCGCNGISAGGSLQSPLMEPLWEESQASFSDFKSSTVTKRDLKIPWWEVATRRSKYRSCPAFSQINIVSALEQTVTDVSDRLERLASSPDLKESELDDLRRTAAILRRQSSAVSQSVSSGYFSLERQASCDSVSSVNSSISNVTHLSAASVVPRIPPHKSLLGDPNRGSFVQNECPITQSEDSLKNKKGNWLRASLRRAFGKQKRKRKTFIGEPNQSNDSTNSKGHNHSLHVGYSQSREPQSRYYSCNSLQRDRQKMSIDDMCEEHRAKVVGGSPQLEHLVRLQVLLNEKEKIIIESKAELLAAQSQVQKQNEIIAKLQIESKTLKEENGRLLSLVENKFGSLPEMSSSPLLKNFDVLHFSGASSGNYATVQRKGKKIRILVIENTTLGDVSNMSNISVKDSSSIFAGNIEILPRTTWKELDNSIAEIFEKYCNRLDPGGGLGLCKEALFCYKLAEAMRAETLPKPDFLPYGYCVGSVDCLHLWLKGPLQKNTENSEGNLSSLAFQSSLPISTLRNLLNLLKETRRMMLVGPPSCGKKTIAKQLAKCFVTSKGIVPDDRAIVFFRVDTNNGLDLSHLLSTIWPKRRSISTKVKPNINGESISDLASQSPEVLVIYDIHAGTGIIETLQKCLPLSIQASPVIIATITNAPSLVTRLQVHCYFRWVGFDLQEEPVRGLLGRILRRPLLAAEDTSGLSLPIVHRTIDWLTLLWLHLNSLISACAVTEMSFGPTLFADCPIMDQEEARIWFTRKWNEYFAPKMKDVLKKGLCHNWSDPKEWIVSTYPWTEKSTLCELQSINSVKSAKMISSFKLQYPMLQRSMKSFSYISQGENIGSLSLAQPSKLKLISGDRCVADENQSNKRENPSNQMPLSSFLKTSTAATDSKLLKFNRNPSAPLLYRRLNKINCEHYVNSGSDLDSPSKDKKK